MKKEQPRERIREEMQERPARSRNTSSFAASTRKKAARSARPTGSVSHTQQTKSKSVRPVSPAQARRNMLFLGKGSFFFFSADHICGDQNYEN